MLLCLKVPKVPPKVFLTFFFFFFLKIVVAIISSTEYGPHVSCHKFLVEIYNMVQHNLFFFFLNTRILTFFKTHESNEKIYEFYILYIPFLTLL